MLYILYSGYYRLLFSCGLSLSKSVGVLQDPPPTVNGIDRSPKEMNGEVKPKKELLGIPSTETSSQNGVSTSNGGGAVIKPNAVKDVCNKVD